ncbi:RNA polymerase sigma factor [Virgisporangium aurantiacum]|uniref:RNA polymerase sigma factor n=1 Tax=Virgisporangium aurantiacum TaxID=175570 RepID=A0A8J3Z7S2_9ACTN|nr:sigma-70 family RNA polymerase sigma factor [Virgisporangium aurantiacum]GIJ58936.1 RNA polymerase sigma factor [Virgisporangium aurantiacum]
MPEDLAPSRPANMSEDFDSYFRDDVSLLTAFLIKLGADPQEAADAVQETGLKMFSIWGKIDHPRAYARRTAERVYLRSKARRADEDTRLMQGGWAVQGLSDQPSEVLIFNEEASELINMIRMLPPKQRRVFAWRLDGFTPAEVATELKEPVGRVYSALRDANQSMREMWDRLKLEREQRVEAAGRGKTDERPGF